MNQALRKIFEGKGVATLPVVILIGSLVIEIGIASAFIAYYLNQSGFGAKLSAQAFTAAKAGIEDAKIRIVRDKNFTPSPNPYTLSFGTYSAQVTVCRDLKTVSSPCDTAMSGKFEVTALGIAFTKRRQVRAVIYVDSLTGETKLESEQEITL